MRVRIGEQHVEAMRKAVIQRSLQRVVHQVEVAEVKRIDGSKIGLDTEIRAAEVAGRIREIGIERLVGLVQIFVLVIP